MLCCFELSVCRHSMYGALLHVCACGSCFVYFFLSTALCMCPEGVLLALGTYSRILQPMSIVTHTYAAALIPLFDHHSSTTPGTAPVLLRIIIIWYQSPGSSSSCLSYVVAGTCTAFFLPLSKWVFLGAGWSNVFGCTSSHCIM